MEERKGHRCLHQEAAVGESRIKLMREVAENNENVQCAEDTNVSAIKSLASEQSCFNLPECRSGESSFKLIESSFYPPEKTLETLKYGCCGD